MLDGTEAVKLVIRPSSDTNRAIPTGGSRLAGTRRCELGQRRMRKEDELEMRDGDKEETRDVDACVLSTIKRPCGSEPGEGRKGARRLNS